MNESNSLISREFVYELELLLLLLAVANVETYIGEWTATVRRPRKALCKQSSRISEDVKIIRVYDQGNEL